MGPQRRRFLEKMVEGAALVGLVSTFGYCAYDLATAPRSPNFRRPDYIFHDDIEGEHIAFYGGRNSQNLVLEVNRSDGNSDVHPTIDCNCDMITKYIIYDGRVPPISKRQTRVYLLDEQGKFLSGGIAENGATTAQIEDKQEAQRQVDNYLTKIKWNGKRGI